MSADLIATLRKYRTPIVYDAIERFGVRPKSAGYTDSTIRAILPEQGAFCGHACTGRILAETERTPASAHVQWRDVWTYVAGALGPKIMVAQDVDSPPRGCAWGDVSAATFLRLGCAAIVTSGYVRDIREAGAIGFGLFAAGAIVGHASVRFIEIGAPVKVAGLVVAPGDLVHVDEHGMTIIPPEVPLDALVRKIDDLLRAEQAVIAFTAGPEFTIDELERRMDRLNSPQLSG